jgi:hypothetical protein
MVDKMCRDQAKVARMYCRKDLRELCRKDPEMVGGLKLTHR